MLSFGGGGGIDLETLYPTTVYDGSDAEGWTSAAGSGVAAIAGTFAVSMAIFAPDVGSLFLGSGGQHPKHYRDVAALLGATGDWSVTARVASLTGDRICLALNNAGETGGVILYVEANGRVGLVTDWSNSAEVSTGTGACPVAGTGYIGLRSRGGAVCAVFGTGTPTGLPVEWSTLEPGTPRVRVPLARVSLYAAAPSALATSGAFDDVRVRTGL